MLSLFRQQVMDKQHQRLQGHVYLLPSLSSWVMTAFGIIILLSFMLLLIFGTYTRKVIVSGYLVPPQGLSKIVLHEPARIIEVLVKEGQLVTKGEPLVKLSSEKYLSTGETLHQSQGALLKESLSNLDLLRHQQNESTLQQHELLKKKVDSERKNLSRLQDKARLLDLTVKTYQAKVKRLKPLVKEGVISLVEFEGLEIQALQEEQSLLSHQILVEEKKDDILKLESELALFSLDQAQKQYPLAQERTQLQRQIVTLEGAETIIRAGQEGRITGLQATPGDWAVGVPLMGVIPDNATFEACVFVPSASIGFLNEGQSVRLRYAAFPYQRYGFYEGTVKSIAHNLLSPNDIPDPVTLTVPVYRVQVILDSQMVRAYGQVFPLQAGMQLEADILLEKKSLWHWLLTPLHQFKGRV